MSKGWRLTFKAKSSLTKIPSSETIFGAICWAIKAISGEEVLLQFLNRYQTEPPLLVSSMFPLHLFPMIQIKNLESTICWMSEAVFLHYGKVGYMNLVSDFQKGIVVQKKQILTYKEEEIEFRWKIEKQPHFTSLMKNNLFYQDVLYVDENSYFQVFIKTEFSLDRIKRIFDYLEITGIGPKKSWGMNRFHLECHEEVDWDLPYKITLSKVLDEEVDRVNSFYKQCTDFYVSSNKEKKGKFTYFLEGSYLKSVRERDIKGQLVPIIIDQRKIYQYGYAFTF